MTTWPCPVSFRPEPSVLTPASSLSAGQAWGAAGKSLGEKGEIWKVVRKVEGWKLLGKNLSQQQELLGKENQE